MRSRRAAVLPGWLSRGNRIAIAWACTLLLAYSALVSLPQNLERREGEVVNCCAKPRKKVKHGFFHVFYGNDSDAQHPSNVICVPNSDNETIRCPDACTKPVPTGTPRVRRAIHTLSSEQWSRVVNAMWVMRTVPTPDGVDKYGPFYRDWDYFILVHGAHGGGLTDWRADVTGGSSHFATWHGAHVLDFETSLLAVDPQIEALPYLDWAAMPARSALFNSFMGTHPATGNLTRYYERWATSQSSWSLPDGRWSVKASRMPNDYLNVSLTEDSGVGIVDTGPFAYWPVKTGGIANPGGRTIAAMEKQDEIYDAMTHFRLPPGNAKDVWGDMDGQVERLAASQPPGVFARLPLPPFNLNKDYAVDLDATQWRDPSLAGPVPYIVRNNLPTPTWQNEPVESAAQMRNLTDSCLDVGNYIGDLVNCIQGRLTTQTFDLHDNWHMNLGGDTIGIGGPNDPWFWFHHAAIDRMRVQWQHRNRQLRSRAWGYFAVTGFSTSTKVSNSCPADLSDVIGAGPNTYSQPMLWSHTRDEPLFGVGFDRERLMGRSDAGMEATVSAPMRNVDMLCGDVEALYTYDVVVEEKAHMEQMQEAQQSVRLVALAALLLAAVGATLLLAPTLRIVRVRCLSCATTRPISGVEEYAEKYDTRMNDAATAANAEVRSSVQSPGHSWNYPVVFS